MKNRFVHLHGHSEYSLQDGASRIPKLVKQTDIGGMDAIALTDHGVLHGSLEHYKECQKAGIKPIIGVEAYVCQQMDLKTGGNKKEGNPNRYYHLVLLAANAQGLKNILKMSSIANTSGFYTKPRIDHALLSQHREGVIALSACLGGEINGRIMKGDIEGAAAMAKYYKDVVMGPGNYYLELQDHGIQAQRDCNKVLREIAEKHDIPLVVTNDFHYVEHGHARHHCAHVCAGQGRKLSDPAKAYETNEFFIKTPDQMWEIFGASDPRALHNTVEIAERCNVHVEMGKYILPEFPVPEGETEASYLRLMAWHGFRERELEGDEQSKRLNYELDMIEQMGFPGYFLIVADFVNWAREQGIPVGPGRGSAAGSLAAYCLGITDVPPLDYDLLFERFLNPSRISMPDIDMDFCIDRRVEVIEYVRDKYGADRVGKIGTFGRLGAKAAIKDVGRIMEIDFPTTNRISKMVPGKPETAFDDVMVEGSELFAACQQDPQVKTMVELAMELGPRRADGKFIPGIARNFGVHAAGIIISRDPLIDVVPLRYDSSSDSGIPVSAWGMNDCEKIGLVKMDFLGLRNLTVMDKAVKIIKQSKGVDINLRKLPLDDKKVYELFKAGDLLGVFQVEGEGISGVAQTIAPENIEEIGAILALYRPGPMESGIMSDYIDRKKGKKQVEYAHADLEPVLKHTYGCMIYQEQVMQVAVRIAGYTLPEADNLRKIMGKKQMHKIKEEMEKFVAGASAKGYDVAFATKLASDIEKFARYGFNKSHSIGYAYITYQTAYLKANYHVEYMAALLSSVAGDHEKIQIYIDNCKRRGIEVLPPDINHSFEDFTVQDNCIRFGLTAVKNVGVDVVRRIVDGRSRLPGGRFTDLNHFYAELGISVCNARTMESLVRAGCFDSLGVSRAALLEQFPLIVDVYRKALKKGKKQIPGQTTLFRINARFVADPVPVPEVSELARKQMLNDEREYVGAYVSGHPLDAFLNVLPYVNTFKFAKAIEDTDLDADGETITQDEPLNYPPDRANVAVGGMLVNTRKVMAKNGLPMMMGEIQDKAAGIAVVFFAKTFEQYGHLLGNDEFIYIVGKFGFREGKPQVIADHVVPLGQLKVVEIALPANFAPSNIYNIRSALGGGHSPVYFTTPERPTEHIVTDPYFWVTPTAEVLERIENYGGVTVEVKSSS